MRVAIVHDTYTYFGGAERVLHALIRIFPQADVYVFVVTPEKIRVLKSFTEGDINTSWWSQLPMVEKYVDWLKPWAYGYFESLNMSSYDLVISSSHSFSSKAVITHLPVQHVSYIYTPPRYLYGIKNSHQVIHWPILRWLLMPLINTLKRWDYLAAQRPQVLIACSQTVRQRIKRFYQREARVIYPPVDKIYGSQLVIKNRNNTNFLFFSRLEEQKGLKIIVEAFRKMPEKHLYIIGKGSLEKWLKRQKISNLHYLGKMTDVEVINEAIKMAAMVYGSIEEDFGLAPVEMMALGLPVIAYNSGGVAETVVDGKTGILVNSYTPAAFIDAIEGFKSQDFKVDMIRKHARKYSEDRFERQLRLLIK
jgi:glycosyltransferase involved in cell wall biosynthesis